MKPKKQLDTSSHKRKKWKTILISVGVILIIIRLLLPYLVLKFVNKTLAGIHGYYGHVEDIDIALIRGAYQINDLTLVKIDTTKKQDSIPFFTAPQIDLSVEWRAIFKGRIVGEIEVEQPVLNFVQGKHKNENIKQDTTDFKEVIRKLMPLTINRFQINNGQIHFRDPYANPAIDVALKDIQAKAENLSNVNDSNTVLPANLHATAAIYGGNLSMNVKLNPLEKAPTFDLDASLNNMNMVSLNPFFKEYAKFELEKGTFSVYTEFAAKDGAFNGYVKPLIKDMKVSKEGDFLQISWEYLISGAKIILENKNTKKVGTKLPIQGRFENPDAGLWTAISYVLKNAFILALQPSVDHTIDIGKVHPPSEKKTFLQKVFGKKEKDSKKKK